MILLDTTIYTNPAAPLTYSVLVTDWWLRVVSKQIFAHSRVLVDESSKCKGVVACGQFYQRNTPGINIAIFCLLLWCLCFCSRLEHPAFEPTESRRARRGDNRWQRAF